MSLTDENVFVVAAATDNKKYHKDIKKKEDKIYENIVNVCVLSEENSRYTIVLAQKGGF